MPGTTARYSLTHGIPATRIGWLIAEARSTAGLTQEDLADRAGVRKRVVKRWEKGGQIPNDDEVLAVARACEIGVGKLLPPRDTVEFDRQARSLRVGTSVVSVADVHNEAVLATYVQLVRQQRGLGADAPFDIRHEDVDALAETLDLEDVDLEARLVEIVGLPRETAAGLRERMLNKRRIGTTAGIVAGSLGLLPGVGATDAHAAPTPPAAVVRPADRYEANVEVPAVGTDPTPAPWAIDVPPVDAVPDADVAAPAPDAAASDRSAPASVRRPPAPPSTIEIGDALTIRNPQAD